MRLLGHRTLPSAVVDELDILGPARVQRKQIRNRSLTLIESEVLEAFGRVE